MSHGGPPDVRRVAELSLALAAGRVSEVIDALRPLRGTTDTIIEIGEGDAAHATIFPLRSGAVLPLHDHPAMTVISKVLHGRMQIESFEWVDRGSGEARSLGTAELDEASDPVVFGPEPGTLHRITALTDCVFLDLFAPWYDDARPCRYYRVDGSRMIATGEVAP